MIGKKLLYVTQTEKLFQPLGVFCCPSYVRSAINNAPAECKCLRSAIET